MEFQIGAKMQKHGMGQWCFTRNVIKDLIKRCKIACWNIHCRGWHSYKESLFHGVWVHCISTKGRMIVTNPSLRRWSQKWLQYCDIICTHFVQYLRLLKSPSLGVVSPRISTKCLLDCYIWSDCWITKWERAGHTMSAHIATNQQ